MSLALPSPLASRLVPLAGGRPGLRAGLRVAATPAPDAGPAERAILDFAASDETLDRCHERISAAGWRLDAYRRNPIFQNAHQYGDILFTLGQALLTEVRESGGRRFLFQRVEFATAVHPVARIAYGLYRHGFLRAVSVGFEPIRWEEGAPGAACRRAYLEQELLEVSAVGLPANPNALALAFKSGALAPDDLRAASAWCAGARAAAPPPAMLPALFNLARCLKRLMQRL